ncbi:MAG: polysaccharide pyruvyl transferase family protein, partial [Prevotella sp.]|nr:polysaccharide pyruvyl transferase family protein [Prevotella sp.]
VRDAEIVLTTSFHGTAFSLNFGCPLLTIVKSKKAPDSRQLNLMHSLGLDKQVISIEDPFPDYTQAHYDVEKEQSNLNILRQKSLEFLTNALQS